MPFSLVFLNQLLVTTTAATVATFVCVLPRGIRESRFQSIVLLLIVLTVGEIAAWRFSNLWLILATLLFPVILVLIEGNSWFPWARISGACVLQNGLVFLLVSVFTTLPASFPGTVTGWIAWGIQVVAVLATFAAVFDVLNVLGRRFSPERTHVERVAEPSRWPGICIQVPAYNEPPDLLAKTIASLMLQDYPGRWMIQVIDDNTPDPSTWLPIYKLCQQLGDRVQFIHLENWPGFKAGALNEGTRRLPTWVEVVAVVDADYNVQSNFLRATSGHFADEQVALVQAPQQYRGWRGVPYFEGLNYMYEYFFAVGMASRRELNSIACFGSMCLIRRSALEQVGGWNEASITEDVELSIRLLGRGWRGVYDQRCYGTGLMPFDFGALKKQRFRWTFGMIQALKKHWRLFFGLPSTPYFLTLRQRWCFLGMALQYLAEIPPLLFTFLQAATVLTFVFGWQTTSPALVVTLVGPLLLLGVANGFRIWALRETAGCTYSQAIGASLFFLALSWVTARACFSACFRRKGVFLRTPKAQGHRKWQRALDVSAQEIILFCGFLSVALSSIDLRSMQLLPSLAILGLQAWIYAQSLICALAAEGIWVLPSYLFGGSKKQESIRSKRKDQKRSQWLEAGKPLLLNDARFATQRQAIDVKRTLGRKREMRSPRSITVQKRCYYF